MKGKTRADGGGTLEKKKDVLGLTCKRRLGSASKYERCTKYKERSTSVVVHNTNHDF